MGNLYVSFAIQAKMETSVQNTRTIEFSICNYVLYIDVDADNWQTKRHSAA